MSKIAIFVVNDQGGRQLNVEKDEVSPTLRAQDHGHPPLVFENHGQDTRFKDSGDVSQTVTATWGGGGNNTPLVVCIGFSTEHSAKSRSIGAQEEISPTLRAGVVPAIAKRETR